MKQRERTWREIAIRRDELGGNEREMRGMAEHKGKSDEKSRAPVLSKRRNVNQISRCGNARSDDILSIVDSESTHHETIPRRVSC